MTNWKAKLTAGAGVVLALFLVSMLVGPCNGCGRSSKQRKAPPPVPGFTDAGAPAPGAVNDAPTEDDRPNVARPKLTREELEAEAAEMGLRVTSRPKVPAPPPGLSGAGDSSTGNVSSDEQPQDPGNAPAPVEDELWPKIFAKTLFGPGPAGDKVTVWAVQEEDGGKILLKAKWEDFQPPPPPPVPDESILGNRARFQRYFIAGGMATGGGDSETKVEPGIGGGLSYEGWRYKKVTLDAHAAAMVSMTGRFTALGGVGLGF